MCKKKLFIRRCTERHSTKKKVDEVEEENTEQNNIWVKL